MNRLGPSVLGVLAALASLSLSNVAFAAFPARLWSCSGIVRVNGSGIDCALLTGNGQVLEAGDVVAVTTGTAVVTTQAGRLRELSDGESEHIVSASQDPTLASRLQLLAGIFSPSRAIPGILKSKDGKARAPEAFALEAPVDPVVTAWSGEVRWRVPLRRTIDDSASGEPLAFAVRVVDCKSGVPASVHMVGATPRADLATLGLSSTTTACLELLVLDESGEQVAYGTKPRARLVEARSSPVLAVVSTTLRRFTEVEMKKRDEDLARALAASAGDPLLQAATAASRHRLRQARSILDAALSKGVPPAWTASLAGVDVALSRPSP